MRSKRPGTDGDAAFQHLVSRTAGQAFLFGPEDKDVLTSTAWKVADFCGIEITSFTVMDNHFHLLIHCPAKRTQVDDAEILRRYRELYGSNPPARQYLGGQLTDFGRERLKLMMHEMPMFMKMVKQRFSRWYNNKHDRKGTLWEDRYKNTLVANEPLALGRTIAYIESNAKRACMVKGSELYRWSSYAEASAGVARSRRGLCRALGCEEDDWEGAKAMLSEVEKMKDLGEQTLEQVREAVARDLAEGKEVSRGRALWCRDPYLTSGGIVGSEAFIKAMHARNPASSTKTPDGTAPLEKAPLSGLYCNRQLRRPKKN